MPPDASAADLARWRILCRRLDELLGQAAEGRAPKQGREKGEWVNDLTSTMAAARKVARRLGSSSNPEVLASYESRVQAAMALPNGRRGVRPRSSVASAPPTLARSARVDRALLAVRNPPAAEDLRQLRLLLARLDRMLREVARGDVAAGRVAAQEWRAAANAAVEAAAALATKHPKFATPVEMIEYRRLVGAAAASLADGTAPRGPRPTPTTSPRNNAAIRRLIAELGGDWRAVGEVAHQLRPGSQRLLCGLPLAPGVRLKRATRLCEDCRERIGVARQRAEEQRRRKAARLRPARIRIVSGGAPGLGKR